MLFFTKYLRETKNESFFNYEHKSEIKFVSVLKN